MSPRVSTGDRDAVLRQIRWCAAVQTLVNCHCELEEDPVRHVEPVQLVVQSVRLPYTNISKSEQAIAMKFAIFWLKIRKYGPIKVRFGNMGVARLQNLRASK